MAQSLAHRQDCIGSTDASMEPQAAQTAESGGSSVWKWERPPATETPGSCLDRCAKLSAQLEADSDSQLAAVAALRGSVWAFSQQKPGCRVVQLALGAVPRGLQEELVLELHGHVRDAVDSPHANHVIQRVVEVMPVARAAFVADELAGAAAQVARHRFGCRILIRLLEHAAMASSTLVLVDELVGEAAKLSRHSFGHFVIQALLEHGSPVQRRRVTFALQGQSREDVLNVATNRNGCHVLKQAMSLCSLEDAQSVCDALLCDPCYVLQLARNQSGCVVLRAAWRRLGRHAQGAWRRIQAASAELRGTKHGRKLLEALEGDAPFHGTVSPQATLAHAAVHAAAAPPVLREAAAHPSPCVGARQQQNLGKQAMSSAHLKKMLTRGTAFPIGCEPRNASEAGHVFESFIDPIPDLRDMATSGTAFKLGAKTQNPREAEHVFSIFVHHPLRCMQIFAESKTTLSSLHDRVQEQLSCRAQLPIFASGFCLQPMGNRNFDADCLETSLDELGVHDGVRLKCVAGKYPSVPCPCSGPQHMTPRPDSGVVKSGALSGTSVTDGGDAHEGREAEKILSISIVRPSGVVSQVLARPTLTLSSLHDQVEEELHLPSLTSRFCLGERFFDNECLGTCLDELGIFDGAELTCVVGEPRTIPCPSFGWQYIDPKGRIQGPFTLQEMMAWNTMGYFRPNLKMRFHISLPFVEMRDLFPDFPFGSKVKRISPKPVNMQ